MKRIQRVFGNIDALRFVDDRLDEDGRSNFLAYLAEQPAESERVQTWKRQNETIRSAFAGVVLEPVPVWLRLDTMLAERPVRQAEADPIKEPSRIEPKPKPVVPPIMLPVTARSHRPPVIGSAVVVFLAAAILLLLAVRSLLPWPALLGGDPRIHSTGDLHQALMVRGADAYRTFATDPIHPVEIAAAQEQQLDAWLQRRLSIPVHAPDLGAEGWLLLGGRLVPGDLGPGAFYVYEGAMNERMGLYIARTSAAAKPGYVLESVPGGSAVSWISGPVGYVLIVDRQGDWLGRNAAFLKGKVEPSALD